MAPRDRAAHEPAPTRRAVIASAGHTGDESVARKGLTDPDAKVRAAAIGALVRLGVAGTDDVGACLTDAAPVVRRRILELAGRTIAFDPTPLLFDADPSVVEAAAFAAGELQTSAAVARLSAIASSSDDALCREAAVAALGAIGDEAGKAAVLAALDDAPSIRRRAVIACLSFASPEVEELLRRHLDDRDWQVRQAVEDVLAISSRNER